MNECICQPSGTVPEHGEVRRMRWCPRCGELWSLTAGRWCPECKAHGLDHRLRTADVIIRAVDDA